ncbi:hypothetical protein TrLO_g15423 [Triparma laevis f. longispina]|uniref:Uncharacterized protein n=1 Tax=Triparma laevis f. longispina TaxID=1714387 RepID=A0A9W7AMA3_9STRA|nr:hypothetical protein TrLO_g15423 [Triparma laevis f. longispina]
MSSPVERFPPSLQKLMSKAAARVSNGPSDRDSRILERLSEPDGPLLEFISVERTEVGSLAVQRLEDYLGSLVEPFLASRDTECSMGCALNTVMYKSTFYLYLGARLNCVGMDEPFKHSFSLEGDLQILPRRCS